MSFENTTQVLNTGFPFDSADFAMTISSPAALPSAVVTMEWNNDEKEINRPVEIDPDLDDDENIEEHDEYDSDDAADDDDEFEQYMLGDDD